ncbi:hypothetical protein OGATHE_000759 [Ogataea polymorpha]|uniref:Uncharacterized protein n=1 Tax=Ogataea polymorpha TaxID=460523 RepID=A0A9P8PVM7_9ASCO|nr:hypothetical protein OGATHE_000759 [Ogataea polymorpha]
MDKDVKSREQNVREAMKRQADPDERAEVITTALTIEGSTLTPASSKAITKGEDAAVPVPDVISVLSEETRSPITKMVAM